MKNINRLLSFFLSSILLTWIIPFNYILASAICCCKDGFDKSLYTLTGNMAEDVATIAKSQKGRTEAEFGYSGVDAGAWCDEFVADCIENAGADSSIVEHGGTVADFERIMRSKGAVEVSYPMVGDLIFFTKSHVEIVTNVDDGVVYCAGGNNGGRMCKGERRASTVGTTRLFLRPNYPNMHQIVIRYNANGGSLFDDVDYFTSDNGSIYEADGALVEETWQEDYGHPYGLYNASTLGLHKYGCEFLGWSLSPDSGRIFGEDEAITSNDLYPDVKSESAVITLYARWSMKITTPPQWTKVSLERNYYNVGETVNFSCSSDTGHNYTIGIDDADGNRLITYDTKVDLDSTTQVYSHVFENAGNYSCYITAYNDIGLADSERVYFTVYDHKPDWAKVSLERKYFDNTETLNFTLSSDTGHAYTVGIDDADGNRVVTYDTDVNQNSPIQLFTHIFDKAGEYSCYITAYNNYGLADSERIYFTVYDHKPDWAKVTLKKENVMAGETVDFVLTSDTGHAYTVGIDDADGNRVVTYDTDVDQNTTTQNYSHVFKKAGQYSCYITTYNNYGLSDSKRIYFTVSPKADCNSDGIISVADIIMLQKWILHEKNAKLKNVDAADFNRDGVIDVFDLGLLKRQLIRKL